MKQDPLASIIIPNYNHSRYLGDAIGSVLKQTCRAREIIVVDDGSTDNSREVIAQFDGKVRAIFQENRGLSAARNTGIQAARGALIGVLDADDMLEPGYLETLTAELAKHPEADGIYCGYRFVDHLNNPLPQVEARDVPPEKLFQALVDGNFLVPESVLLRKDCYDRAGGFDPSLRALEDLDMWLRVTMQFKVISSRQVLTRHRILPGSMSTDASRQFENRMKVMAKHFGSEREPGRRWSTAQRWAYGRAYLISAVEYLQDHDRLRASECVRGIACACPELLNQMETFYELGCGSQPKGYRGEFGSLDLEENYRVVMELLDSISRLPQIEGVEHRIRSARANAHYAFGMLAYGQGRTKAARDHLFIAARLSPALLLDGILPGFMLRSLAGRGLMRRLRILKRGEA